jgi:hypothetical protein
LDAAKVGGGEIGEKAGKLEVEKERDVRCSGGGVEKKRREHRSEDLWISTDGGQSIQTASAFHLAGRC